MSLKDYEAAFLERWEGMDNPLGWKPWGRDEDGNARMRCAVAGRVRNSITGEKHSVLRICVMTITERGLVYDEQHVG